jgi:hypothetical protein
MTGQSILLGLNGLNENPKQYDKYKLREQGVVESKL